MSELSDLLQKLVSYRSVSPDDANSQDFIAEYLQKIGFQCHVFNNPPVSNLYAQFGSGDPLLLFAGHTDVVPPGPEFDWETPPFSLVEKDGYYYGRGVADMKGSLAAMMIAAKQFTTQHPNGSLAFLITSGEEGNAYDKGTPYVMQQLAHRGIQPKYCIVGEPSSQTTIADMIKIGRRGSLTGQMILHGKQGHVAYPHLAENPIHTSIAALLELTTTQWDLGNEFFPPSSLQVTHIHAGGEANNIIPGTLTLYFNIRYSTEQTSENLKSRISEIFQRHQITSEIQWQHSGKPFITQSGHLLPICSQVIQQITGKIPEYSTSGGTSDARFIAPYGIEVIELGPLNASIHQINERVSIRDLEILVEIYTAICVNISPK